MTITLDATLGKLARYIPPPVITAADYRHIQSTVACLPAALTNYFGFETVLGSSNTAADFALFFADDGPGRSIIANDGLPKALELTDEWQRIRELCRKWLDPQAPEHRRMNSIWLEFDVAGPPRGVPIPGIFVGMASEDRNNEWLTDSTLPVLFKHPLSPSFRNRLLKTLRRLPEQAVLFQAGLMLSRKSEAVRLCLTHRGFCFPRDVLRAYMERIGWPGDFDEFYDIIHYLSQYADKVLIDIDILDGAAGAVSPKLGLECYLRRQPVSARWKRFLDSLVDMKLSRPDKRDGCLQWAGKSVEALPHIAAPVVVHRQIHHVKLVYQPGFPVQAKAYLLCTHNVHKTASQPQPKSTRTTALTI